MSLYSSTNFGNTWHEEFYANYSVCYNLKNCLKENTCTHLNLLIIYYELVGKKIQVILCKFWHVRFTENHFLQDENAAHLVTVTHTCPFGKYY
jgi:hypothetical protein